MKRYLSIVLGLGIAVSAAAGAADKEPTVPKLTVGQIIARNVDARGGLKAWRAVETLKLSGELEAGGKKNSELPFVLSMKRPHKSRLEIRFRDQTAVQTFDGTQGWKVRPFLGRDDAEPFSPAEEKAAREWEELDGPLVDYKRKGNTVRLQGVESVEGHPAYKLEVTMKDGEKRHLWVDASTFLERKIEGQPRKLDGKMRNVAVYYRDYRKQDGLTMPFEFETKVEGGRMPHKMQIEKIAVNKSLDDALFGKPALAMAQTQPQPAAK